MILVVALHSVSTMAVAAAPVMEVGIRNQLIPNRGEFNFGDVALGWREEVELSIRNLGPGTLSFKTTASGGDAGDFEDCYRHRFMDLSEKNMVWVCGFGITQKDIEEMKERGYTDIDTIIKKLAERYGK